MATKHYKLSDEVISGDIISSNIIRRKEKLYHNIKNFSSQKTNDGINAENILRLVLDGVNLNHLSKNHPHVDIAIINPIEGFAQKNEIISVKSSIKAKPTLSNLISDTKSIKLESMFSYIVFANSNYELNYEKMFFSPKKLLVDSIRKLKQSKKKHFKEVVNLVAYYIMFKNQSDEQINFDKDLDSICNDSFDLIHGKYNYYRMQVLRRLVYLDNPISLGGVYLQRNEELTCVIKKTIPIKLNKYWEKLVDIWLDEDFFESEAVKYLTLPLVKDLFGISQRDDFPIEVSISFGDYAPSGEDFTGLSDREKIEIAKKRAEKRTNKLYVATKFKDANFGENEEEVNKFFLKSIDMMEDNPKVIKKFSNFVSTLENPPKLTNWWSQNESVIGMKVSEADKIKFLKGFEFYRVWSDLYGYKVEGKRMILPMERISIYKQDNSFFVEIVEMPKYQRTTQEFDNLESVKDYLLSYEWYDLKN